MLDLLDSSHEHRRSVVLDIQDQGRGLRDHLTQQNGKLASEALGVGIQGMRERVSQLGGVFDVEFTDTGTTMRGGVPLKTDMP
jgi:signal transduction histidine kinase